MTAAALQRVQANVLRPASRVLRRSAFNFLTLDGPAPVGALLGRLLDEGLTVSEAEARSRPPDSADHPYVAVGFTCEGLERLGHHYRPDPIQVPKGEHVPDGEQDPFCHGMRARAKLLSDPDTGRWKGSGCHMLVWVADRPDGSHERYMHQMLGWAGFPNIHVEQGSYAGDEPVVLGFSDGTSQPFVSELASNADRLPGGGTVTLDGWRPVPLGEFILGSTDAGNERLAPEPEWLCKGGTFLVYRKYLFDHDAFEEFIGKEGTRFDPVDTERGVATAAAKVLGRYRQGESPPGRPVGYDAVIPPGTSPGTSPAGRNDFRYGRDTYGYSCPLGAHIRRAHPRDALGFDGKLTVRHRIIRRGVPWHDRARQGLHFVCVNARIQDQFEFIQRQWLNTGSAFRLGSDIDLIAGSLPPIEGLDPQEVRFVVQGSDPVILRVPEPFAKLEGGDYFLMPGMQGLTQLAGETA